MSETIMDAAVIEAYRETDYRVQGDPPFVLRIGQQSEALAAAHERHRVDSSAYITACNPYSELVDDASNARRHLDFGSELRQRGQVFFEGVGQHPSNEWPGEASYLILGLTLEDSRALGTRLQQNAIVWSGSDAVPRLILLR